jgi:hypothetical protein
MGIVILISKKIASNDDVAIFRKMYKTKFLLLD